METISTLLTVNTVFVTVLGYPLSYIELIGTIANVWSVWLIAKKNILTWPIGIVGVVLFLFLFYQIRLYSDLLEQVYYLVTSVWGWWLWQTAKKSEKEDSIATIEHSFVDELKYIAITIVGTLSLWRLTILLPIVLPTFFPEAPAFPLLDALTTTMSFVATYLMIKRRVSCWYYWIIVDVIGIGLYFMNDVKLLSLLYVVFLMLAIKGVLEWKKTNIQLVANDED